MAKLIWRSGKIALTCILCLLTVMIILYGSKIFTYADTASSPAESSSPDTALAEEMAAREQAAKIHIENGAYAEAEQIYNNIIAQYPATEYALEAQKNLAIMHIKCGNDDEALAEINTLLTNFSSLEGIAKAVNDIANTYRLRKNYEQAREYYQYAVDNWPDYERALWSYTRIAICNLKLGNDQDAEAAIDKLCTDFSDHEYFVPVLCYDIGGCYRELGRTSDACALYQYALTRCPQSQHAVGLQSRLAIAYIELGQETEAQAAIDKLFTDYAGDAYLATAANDIANTYRMRENYEQAREYYQYAVDNWPDYERVLWSYTRLALCNLRLGNNEGFQSALARLVSNCYDHEYFPAVINNDIGGFFRGQERHYQLFELYEYIVNNWPVSKGPIWAQKHLVIENLRAENYEAADNAVAKLLADFAEHEDLAKTINEIAYGYSFFKDSGKALELYNYVLTNFPVDDTTLEAQKGAAIACIGLNQDEQVEVAVDALMTTFHDLDGMARAVFIVGEEYFELAKEMKKQGLTKIAGENFTKALNIYQQIVDELPESDHAHYANYFVAACHRHLHQYFQAVEYFQKVVDNWPDFHLAGSAQNLAGCYTRILKERGDVDAEEADPFIKFAFENVVYNYSDGPAHRYQYALEQLGLFHKQKGQWAEAVMYFEMVRQEFPDRKFPGSILNYLIQSYEGMGEPAMVIDVCEEFVQTCPDDRRLEEIETKLAELKNAN